MELSTTGQRVLGCLIEKALTTPQQYPLSVNALRTAANQTTGRDPVVEFDDDQVRVGLDELKTVQLVRTEYARGSHVPKSAHRLAEQFDLDPAQQALLGLLLLRGPQTAGELKSRSGRLHQFASRELVEAVLESLAAHRFGAMVELTAREPGQKEPRWRHLLGPDAEAMAPTASTGGRYRPFHDAVLAGDWERAIAQLADDVVFRSPAVYRPYHGAAATADVLSMVAQVFEDFTYVDVLDGGDRAGLVFTARVGDREIQGWDYLVFDDDGQIREFTVMLRPLSGLQAVVARMQTVMAGDRDQSSASGSSSGPNC